MATVDLWPDDIATDAGLDGPTIVLREQAALLGQKTKNLVEAEVETTQNHLSQGTFIDAFVILSPVLGYRHTLFYVIYPLEFYPTKVVWDGFKPQLNPEININVGNTPARYANSQQELESILQEIFSHSKTIRLVQSLISRTRS